VLLARVSALIDLLIKAGSREAEAAQIMMRKLVAAGIPPPKQGAMPAGGSVSSRGAPISVMDSTRKAPSRNIRPSRARSRPFRRRSGCNARSINGSGTAGGSGASAKRRQPVYWGRGLGAGFGAGAAAVGFG
jgi:hypothetical protein